MNGSRRIVFLVVVASAMFIMLPSLACAQFAVSTAQIAFSTQAVGDIGPPQTITVIAGGAEERNLLDQGIAAFSSGRFEDAEIVLSRAVQSARERGEKVEVAATLTSLGNVYLYEERFREAEKAYREADLFLKKSHTDGMYLVRTLEGLGAIYSLQGRYEDAMTVLKKAIRIIKTDDLDQKVAAQILNELGLVYFRQQKLDKAEAVTIQAMQISVDQASALATKALNNLGLIYQKRQQYEKAEQAYNASLKKTEELFGPMHPDVAMSTVNMGLLYTEMHRWKDAEDQFLRSLSITEHLAPVVEGRVVRILHYLGMAYLHDGNKAEAEHTLERAVQIALRNPHVVVDTEVAGVIEDYSNLLKATGRLDEADRLYAKVQGLRAQSALTIRVEKLRTK